MYIESVPNRNSPPAVLLRESWREGGKTKKRTIANLSECPPEAIAALRRALKGEKSVAVDEVLKIKRSIPHGHVEAVLSMMRKLGMESLIGSRKCRERDLVAGMIAQRVIHPGSKLEATRAWSDTTLGRQLGIEDADVDELYDAMDWLLGRQTRIEKKLGKRHLSEGGRVLFDVSSSSYHGHTCPLAQFGYNRDGEKLQSIVYGLLADNRGCPVGVGVYPGNTADPRTVPDQVDKLRGRFGLQRVALVGDRGMLTQARIDALKSYPGLGWISALRFSAVRKLAEKGTFQPSLFDKHCLAEISDDDYPGERLIVCYNPLLADERRRKRIELLDATETALTRLANQVARRTKTPMTADKIGLKAGAIVGKRKMAKHFTLAIAEGLFDYERNQESIRKESETDGFYIVRTSEPPASINADETVRTYKSLGQVEQAFRCLKSVDLLVRPIRHRTEDHVRAHIFLCVLAYYVQWHMRKALAPVLFHDEQLDSDRWTRDAVAPAKASQGAKRKKHARVTPDGWPVHSFRSLLDHMGTLTRNYCYSGKGKTRLEFERDADPTPLQDHVFSLIREHAPAGCTQ